MRIVSRRCYATHMVLLFTIVACGRPELDVASTDSTVGSEAIDTGEDVDTQDSGGSFDTSENGAGFRGLIVPLYAAQCESCHGYWGSSDEPDDLWEHMVERTEHRLIIAGDPSQSMFYTKMLPTSDVDFPSGNRMPLQSGSVSASEVTALGDWIDAGAEASGFDVYTDIHNDQGYHCRSCHENFGTASSAEMYELFLSQEVGGVTLLVPGDAGSSLIYQKVAGGTQVVGEAMPLNHSFATEEVLGAIADWVLDGAPND